MKSEWGFKFDDGGYTFESKEIKDDPTAKGMSMITITKDGNVLKQFQFPSYKIWNIPAHAGDIIEDLESGLRIAGSDGLGGNAYQPAK